MSETVWLASDLVQAVHAHRLEMFGGPAKSRDEGVLESAVGRPIDRAGYGDPDLAELAAGEIDEAGLARWIRGNGPDA